MEVVITVKLPQPVQAWDRQVQLVTELLLVPDKELGKLRLEMEVHLLLEQVLALLKQQVTVLHLEKVLVVDKLELDQQEAHQVVYRQEVVNQAAKKHAQHVNVSRLYQD